MRSRDCLWHPYLACNKKEGHNKGQIFKGSFTSNLTRSGKRDRSLLNIILRSNRTKRKPSEYTHKGEQCIYHDNCICYCVKHHQYTNSSREIDWVPVRKLNCERCNHHGGLYTRVARPRRYWDAKIKEYETLHWGIRIIDRGYQYRPASHGLWSSIKIHERSEQHPK